MQRSPGVNRLSERAFEPGTFEPVDPERHALEMRIEDAKIRIAEDLRRASALLMGVTARAGRGLGRGLVVTGLLVVGVIAVALMRRRRRRIRITWK